MDLRLSRKPISSIDIPWTPNRAIIVQGLESLITGRIIINTHTQEPHNKGADTSDANSFREKHKGKKFEYQWEDLYDTWYKRQWGICQRNENANRGNKFYKIVQDYTWLKSATPYKFTTPR